MGRVEDAPGGTQTLAIGGDHVFDPSEATVSQRPQKSIQSPPPDEATRCPAAERFQLADRRANLIGRLRVALIRGE